MPKLVLCGLLLSVLTLMSWLTAGCEVLPAPAPAVPTFVFVAPPTPTLSPDSVYTVGRGTIQAAIKARGRVASVQESLLTFNLSGFLKKVDVKPGDVVQKDDVLAELDSAAAKVEPLENAIVDAEYELQLKTLEIQQASSEPIEQEILRTKSEVNLARISLQQAQAAYDRVVWRGDDAASGPEAFALQRATLVYETAQAVYAATLARKDPLGLRIKYLETQAAFAKIKLERARARLETAKADIQLKAPFSGLIVSVEKKVGDAVDPYESIGAIADPSQLRVEATVIEADMAMVTFGQSVSINLDAYPDKPLAGKITVIASQPAIWQGKNAYQMTIEFDDPTVVPATIRMGADVSIFTRIAHDVLLVPSEAIKTDGERKYVEVPGNPAWNRVDVATGITDGPRTEVLWGLAEGDTVRLR